MPGGGAEIEGGKACCLRGYVRLAHTGGGAGQGRNPTVRPFLGSVDRSREEPPTACPPPGEKAPEEEGGKAGWVRMCSMSLERSRWWADVPNRASFAASFFFQGHDERRGAHESQESQVLRIFLVILFGGGWGGGDIGKRKRAGPETSGGALKKGNSSLVWPSCFLFFTYRSKVV